MTTKRLEDLIKSVNSRLQPLLEFDRFYAALYDPSRSIVEFPWVVQNGEQVEWGPRPYHATRWLLDSVIAAKAPRLMEQGFEEELEKDGLQYWPEDHLPRSWFAAPMVAEDRVVGALVIESWSKPRAFGENDVRVLSTVARQVAVAIENVRLVEQRDRKIAELSALHEMGQILNSGIRSDERAILHLIYKQASQLMDTSNLYIALYDPITDNVSFPLMFRDGNTVEIPSRSGGKGRTEWIIKTRQPIRIETWADSIEWYKEFGHDIVAEPFASWVGVPMVARDKVLGVIATYHKTKDYFYTQDDQEILSLMANQAAEAIENKRLYDRLEEIVRELQERNVQLAAMQEIGIAITSQLELTTVLGLIVENANRIAHADFSTLFTYNPLQHCFEKGIRKGRFEIEPSIPSNAGFSAGIAKTQIPVFVRNIEEEPSMNPVFLERTNTKSFAGVPLVVKGETVGVLFVNYSSVRSFSPDEQDTILLFANQAAVSIENATLFEERTQALALLRQEQYKTLAASRLAMANTIATEFVHRMNNIAGTTPVRVAQIQELLNRRGYDDPQIARYLEAISSDVDSLLKAAKAIRASTAVAEQELVEIDVLVFAAIQRVIAPPGINISNECSANLPWVRVPSGQLVDTLENLIRNGVEAIQHTGTVTVTGKVETIDNLQWVIIEVKDTGRGIPSEELTKIGDLFFTTKAGGMGFGLWRAKTFIESLGGKISVSSELGKGTTIKISLSEAKEV